MRLFVAAHVTDEARAEAARFIEKARKFPGAPKDAKWVLPQNFHFTLKFLGDVEESRLDVLKRALTLSVQNAEPFSIALRGVGVFPDWKRPRVLWAGVEDSSGGMAPLASRVEETTVFNGFAASDRPFAPHLTLARFQGLLAPSFVEALQGVEDSALGGSIPVDRIFLMRSVLRPSGPEYGVVDEFPFY